MSDDLARDLIVRTCADADLEPLEWSGQFTHHREIIREAYARQLSGEVEMLIGEVAQFPAAQLWLDLSKRWDERVGVLWALRVHPKYQGLGLGTQLLKEGERRLLRRGLEHAEIGVERDNPRARRLYERLGYEHLRDVVESYAYRTPSGVIVHATADQWLLRKRLLP